MSVTAVRYNRRGGNPTGPACLGCGTASAKLVADHCHEHHWIRGGLCYPCNKSMIYVDAMAMPPEGVRATIDALVAQHNRCSDCVDVAVEDLDTGAHFSAIFHQGWKSRDELLTAAPPSIAEVEQMSLEVPVEILAATFGLTRATLRKEIDFGKLGSPSPSDSSIGEMPARMPSRRQGWMVRRDDLVAAMRAVETRGGGDTAVLEVLGIPALSYFAVTAA